MVYGRSTGLAVAHTDTSDEGVRPIADAGYLAPDQPSAGSPPTPPLVHPWFVKVGMNW